MRAQTSMPRFGQARLTALGLLDGKAAPGKEQQVLIKNKFLQKKIN